MRIIREDNTEITYEMRDIIKKILQVLKEDQSLDFGPRLNSASVTKKTLQETISSKKQLLKKSQETYLDLQQKLDVIKKSNDSLREKLLKDLGSEL